MTGQDPCTPCPAGTFTSVQAATSCFDCPVGTFNGSLGQTACTDCGTGTFSSVPASTTCSNCSAGTFNSAQAQTACTNCGTGSFSSAAASTTCTSCSPGTFSSSLGQTACTDCSPGSYQDASAAVECLDCEDGTFQPEAGATMCLDRNERRCWKVKDLKNPAFVKQTGVVVTDEVASGNVDLTGVSLYCAPAGLDGDAVADPDPRQCCVKAKGDKLDPAVSYNVTGVVGGSLQLQLSKRALVCEQCAGAPIDNPLQCWKVKDLKTPAAFVGTADLAVTDEFATDTVDVKKPALFCSPASLDGSPISDPLAQQCCYKATGAKLATASTVNASGSVIGALELSVQKPSLICEPCVAVPGP
ncbi:MAG: hypothetical protein ABR538_13470 [Candidatus Binatia bacterium]